MARALGARLASSDEGAGWPSVTCVLRVVVNPSGRLGRAGPPAYSHTLSPGVSSSFRCGRLRGHLLCPTESLGADPGAEPCGLQ